MTNLTDIQTKLSQLRKERVSLQTKIEESLQKLYYTQDKVITNLHNYRIKDYQNRRKELRNEIELIELQLFMERYNTL